MRFKTWLHHFVVFMVKILYSHSALSGLDYKWVMENGLESLIKFWGGGLPHNGLASIILQIVSF